MKNKLAIVAAASVPLILSTAGALAGESQFQTPTTQRAEQTQTLLSRAAHAVNIETTRIGEAHVSNLWLFPTAAEDTVFVQYIVSAKPSSLNAEGSERHFELLRMKGDRIVEQRDLTHVADDSTLNAKRADGVLDWSASIGTGHVASGTEQSAAFVGSPASPHWSASIGTGHATSSTEPLGVSVGSPASPHWSASIGTGHANSNSRRFPS